MSSTTRPDDLIAVGGAPSLSEYLRDLWKRREYMIAVPQGELRAQHMNTLLGNLWHLINPMLLVGVYYLVFGVIIGTDRGVDNFIAFLAIGIFSFRFTQNSIQQGANAIAGNDGLIRSIHFPRAILPISTVVSQVLTLVPALAVMVAIALATGQRPLLGWLLIPVIFGFQALFNLGGAFVAARVTDSFRDFQNVLPFFFRLLFYMSGILYSVDRFVESETARQAFHLNPAFAYITIARNALLAESLPGTVVASAGVWTVGLLIGGFLYFRAAENTYGRG